jgi:starch synthase
MACGRPVVMAAQDGAATDIVKDYGCGLAVPPDNPEALAGAILDLLPQPQEIDGMGRRGREAVQTHFAGPQVLPSIEASLLKLGASRYHL